MVNIDRACPQDRANIERLIAEYHVSEGLRPRKERIANAIEQYFQGLAPGVLLVSREEDTVIGVALGVSTPSAELGRVMTVNDFFVSPAFRRKGVGREMAERLLKESRLMGVDEVNLEVVSGNEVAASFWKSMGFELAARTLFKLKLSTVRSPTSSRPSSLHLSH